MPLHPLRARRARVARLERLAHGIRAARTGGGRAGLRRLLPELPGKHGPRRGVLEVEPGRSGRQGVRRPRRRRRSSGRRGRRGHSEGRHHRRLVRRLRDRVGVDLLLRAVRRGRDVRRHQRHDLQGRHHRRRQRGIPRARAEAAVGRVAVLHGAEPHLPRGKVTHASADPARQRRPASPPDAVAGAVSLSEAARQDTGAPCVVSRRTARQPARRVTARLQPANDAAGSSTI